jgi:ornithine cyclodeaminase/alanine dehydrogenase-like protein (mu-crystallin family)
MKIISTETMKALVSMPEAIQAMRAIFGELAAGHSIMPLRCINTFGETMLFYKPSYSPKKNYAAVKLLTQVESNPSRHLPMIQGYVFLMDSTNGNFLAMMDGKFITALRTGATSGLATDLLARPDSTIAAIFGAGVQGATQLEAVCAVRPIKKAYIFDINPKAAETYARQQSEKLGIHVYVAESLDVLREADVICTATGARAPLFHPSQLKPNVHINAIGSFQPHMQELPAEWVAASKIYVDHVDSCLAETGDLLIPISKGLMTRQHILGEIGEVVNGTLDGRMSPNEKTLFKSVGVAVQDLAAAALVYEKALAQECGTEVTL